MAPGRGRPLGRRQRQGWRQPPPQRRRRRRLWRWRTQSSGRRLRQEQPEQGGAQPLLEWRAPLECVRTKQQQLLRGQRLDPRRHCSTGQEASGPFSGGGGIFGRACWPPHHCRLPRGARVFIRCLRSIRRGRSCVRGSRGEAHILSTTPSCYNAVKDIDRVSTLPFSSSVKQSEAAQQLIRTTKSCLSSILRLFDERNSRVLLSAMRIPWWEYPLQ